MSVRLEICFAEEFLKSIIDVAANLHVSAGAIGPYQQAKVVRPVGEVHELDFWWRVFQNVVNAFSRLQQGLGYQLDVAGGIDLKRNGDAGTWVSVGPIDQAVLHHLGM